MSKARSSALSVEGPALVSESANRGRVLVVDDEPSARTALGRLLAGEQFEVQLAADALAAIDMAGSFRPDIVITDLQMPGMDGVDLCRRLHAIDPEPAVIVVTAFADMPSAVNAMRAGASDYLTKPLDCEAVLLAIRRALDRRADEIEREQLRQQAQNLYRDALGTTQACQEALSIVSHDLRSPLSVLSYRAAELARVPVPPESKQEILTIASSLGRVTTQMQHLVDDLLDATTMAIGTVRLDCEECDARELLVDACELRPLALQKRIALRVRARSGVCAIRVDRQRLGQALNNLIANAIKFSRSGTEIELSLDRVKGGVQFAVRDEGPGIESDEVANVFDRFWQGKGRRSGVGLGLFIVKRVVDAHHGKVWVDSRPGVGSTFYVFIPALHGAVGAPSLSERGHRESARGCPESVRM